MFLLWQEIRYKGTERKVFVWWIFVHSRYDISTKNKSPVGAATPKGLNKHNPIHANVRAT